ncbi:hypothetical protein MTO96_020578 [Rhipicephalus appendiculatus]
MSSDDSQVARGSAGDCTVGSAGAGATVKDDKKDPTLGKAELGKETKPKPKYPVAMTPGRFEFLQRRLNKPQKYFDSGDYNMAIAKGLSPEKTPVEKPTGDVIPTVESLSPRRASLGKSKLATESP